MGEGHKWSDDVCLVSAIKICVFVGGKGEYDCVACKHKKNVEGIYLNGQKHCGPILTWCR